MDSSRYFALYETAIPQGARARRPLPALPALDARHFRDRLRNADTSDLTLPQLYSAGVECGHSEARLQLKRRLGEVNAQLEHFRAVRDKAQGDKQQLASELLVAQRAIATLQMQVSGTHVQTNVMLAHIRHLEAEVEKARARIEEIEASKAWRMTAPIRRGGRRIKVLIGRSARAVARTSPVAATSVHRRDDLERSRRASAREAGRPKVTRPRGIPAHDRRIQARGIDGATFIRVHRRAARIDHHPGVWPTAAHVHVLEERAGPRVGRPV
jgi:hypothetical protein